ncbi:MAG TPA: hypothetical protein PLJ21_12175 [Pseudobdellovibrionaceae bacterium]|nr:hypothetical protein [Pseudobdellovibrionaceae bacterium]
MSYFLTIFFILSLSIFTNIQAQQIEDKTDDHDKIVFDGPLSTSHKLQLRLQVSKNDPSNAFTKLILLKNSVEVFKLENLQGTQLDKLSLPKNVEKVQNLFALLPLGPKIKQKVLILMEDQGVGDGSKLTMISINDTAPTILYSENIKITEIRDINKDGLYDLLKSGGFGEPIGPDNYSYDPYLVFKQINKNQSITFNIDEKLSKKWSKESNYRWWGPQYNESKRVNRHGEAIKVN